MDAPQREEDVARDDEASARRETRGEGGERVVARDVCVDDLDLVPAGDAREAHGAGKVERASQREREDAARLSGGELVAQRRRGGERDENFVAALREAAREVCEVPFAAAESACRTDLEDSQRAFKLKLS